MNLAKSLAIGTIIELLIRILCIIAAFWLGHLLVSKITDTYHDTHVICLQVTHHSHECR